MSNVKRVFVEKKGEYAVQAKGLLHEIKGYLGIKDVESVRVLIRYDVENLSDETFEKACRGIFAEMPVDILWDFLLRLHLHRSWDQRLRDRTGRNEPFYRSRKGLHKPRLLP